MGSVGMAGSAVARVEVAMGRAEVARGRVGVVRGGGGEGGGDVMGERYILPWAPWRRGERVNFPHPLEENRTTKGTANREEGCC